VHQRRILKADKDSSFPAPTYAVSPASIACFLNGQTDDQRLARLARALSLVEIPPEADRSRGPISDEDRVTACAKLPALFGLPRLALTGKSPDTGENMPRLTAILRRGASGDGGAATRLAVQRLRGSGFTPALREVPASGPSVRRALAATLFPLCQKVLETLREQFRPLTIQG
jgi:CRISPR-associated protein Csx17